MPDIRPISEELAKKARDELNEVPERIQDDIDALKLWLTKQPHLRSRTDDQFLVAFLRSSKYSLERAKEKIDLFYTIRTWLFNMKVEDDPNNNKLWELIRCGAILPLPMTEKPDGPRFIIARFGMYDPENFTVHQIMRMNLMVNDILMLEDDNLIIAGQHGILDLTNTTMAIFLLFNPTLMKKMMRLAQDASPIRLKGMHYIHTPSFFETFYNLFKTFMNEKTKKRLHVHGDNLELLYEHIPKRLLPTEYGGEAGPIQNIIDEWEKKILSYQAYFNDEQNYGVDEKKRIGYVETEETMFGVDGSFRKLNVD